MYFSGGAIVNLKAQYNFIQLEQLNKTQIIEIRPSGDR
jgi:hypothetical protein